MSEVLAHPTTGISHRSSKIKTQSPYMTCSEAANYLRKTEAAVRNMVLRRQISAYKVNRRLLFKQIELERWIEKGRVGNQYGY